MNNNNLQQQIEKLLQELKLLIYSPSNSKAAISSTMGFDKYKRSRSPVKVLPTQNVSSTAFPLKKNTCSYCHKTSQSSPKFKSIKLYKTGAQPVYFCSSECFSKFNFT